MPSVLPNTTTTDKYVQVLGGSAIYDRGQFLIANNPVSLIVQRGPDKSTYTEDEYPYLTPTSFPFQRSGKEYIVGVKVKSAIVGQPAQVSGFLLEPDVAGVGLGSAFLASVGVSGGVTPGQASVQIQKNGVIVGTEPILDFEDLAAFLWTLTDDAANTRVKVNGPRILTGYINGAGAITNGTGFTAARNSAGNYTITFTTPFSGVPIVIAIPNQNSGANPSGFIANPAAGSVQIIAHVAGVPTDTPMGFLAMLLV